ncbi:MAG TPA: Ig-like domain-containing protein, partial [Cyclobacteriaceae bacterium]
IWNDQQAKGIAIPEKLIGTITDSLEHKLIVRLLKEGNITPIIGSYQKQNDAILFEPIISFTRGLSYEILLNNKIISQLKIPDADQKNAPELLSIYPAKDTLPENLLKMHFLFSKPMQESQSVRHLTLLRNNTDTLHGTFLDLQPELWNEEGTILTVWLDPGRIKRDLQPNKQLGTPLQSNTKYKLIVSNQWKDKNGASLTRQYQKDFITTLRDSISPNPKIWNIQTPPINSTQPLVINFHESLDYNLINTTLHIIDHTNVEVKGKWQLNENADKINFIPALSWAEDDYQLQVESRLEDLSGNNLNRAFDIDVKHKTIPSSSAEIITIPFTIKKK